MKVLIICNCATGLEVFRGMLIKELVNRGNSINVIIPVSDEHKELDAEKRIEKMKCTLIRIPMERRGMNPVKDFSLFRAYHKTIKETKPDLIITYTIKPNIYSKVLRSFAEIFSMDLMIRPSCFYCPYASLERSGDITIGDFWGIEKVDSSFSDNEGISLVLCNNHEGENFYDISKKTGQRKDKKYSSSVLTQPNLYKPTDFGEEYDSFWHDYKKHGFKRIAAKYGKIGVFGKIFYYKRAIKYRLQK